MKLQVSLVSRVAQVRSLITTSYVIYEGYTIHVLLQEKALVVLVAFAKVLLAFWVMKFAFQVLPPSTSLSYSNIPLSGVTLCKVSLSKAICFSASEWSLLRRIGDVFEA